MSWTDVLIVLAYLSIGVLVGTGFALVFGPAERDAPNAVGLIIVNVILFWPAAVIVVLLAVVGLTLMRVSLEFANLIWRIRGRYDRRI